MADDYIVIPSFDDDKATKPAKEAESADGKTFAMETNGDAANSGAHDQVEKVSERTAKQIDSSAADLGTGETGKKSAQTATRLGEYCAGIIFMLLMSLVILPVRYVSMSIVKEREKGPEFQIHSASASTFSISWWSETVNADWNVSLGVKNLNRELKFSYDFVQVSIFYGDTQLSTTMLTPFRQVALDHLLLNVNFPPLPAKIDAGVSDSIRESKRLNNSITVNIVINAKISRDDGRTSKDMKWSKSLIASCKNIKLQFSPYGEKAEMIAQKPVSCEVSS